MTYRFGDFELWRERYELRRGAAPVALGPRVFEVLAYLVHHRQLLRAAGGARTRARSRSA